MLIQKGFLLHFSVFVGFFFHLPVNGTLDLTIQCFDQKKSSLKLHTFLKLIVCFNNVDVCLLHLHCALMVLSINSADIYYLSPCCAYRISPRICETWNPFGSAYSCQCLILVFQEERESAEDLCQELCFTECGNC